jgi:hypothetical protein
VAGISTWISAAHGPRDSLRCKPAACKRAAVSFWKPRDRKCLILASVVGEEPLVGAAAACGNLEGRIGTALLLEDHSRHDPNAGTCQGLVSPLCPAGCGNMRPSHEGQGVQLCHAAWWLKPATSLSRLRGLQRRSGRTGCIQSLVCPAVPQRQGLSRAIPQSLQPTCALCAGSM